MARRLLDRRGFLKWGTGVGVGLISLMLSVPAIGFVLSPLFHRTRLSWVRVGPIDQLPMDLPTPLVATVPTGEGWETPAVRRIVYVVRRHNQRPLALTNVCSHMQCDVHWEPKLDQFLCPCHGGLYNIEGTQVGGPPPGPLPEWVHEFREEQGRQVLYIRNQYTSAV